MHTWCLVQVRCSQLGELYSVTVRRARCSLLMELENCALTLDTTVANNLLAKLMASLLGVLRRELTELNSLITLTAETSRFKTMEASKIRKPTEKSLNSNTLKSKLHKVKTVKNGQLKLTMRAC